SAGIGPAVAVRRAEAGFTTNSEPRLWSLIRDVDQPEHLVSRCHEGGMRAPGERELAGPGFTWPTLMLVDVGGPKLDPRPAGSALVIDQSTARVGGRKIRELHAERAAIVEGHEQDRMRKAEVPLDHAAVQHLGKQTRESIAKLRT